MAKRRPAEAPAPIPALVAEPPMPPTIAERRALGQRMRAATAREAHSGWAAGKDRRDPIEILIESGRARVQDLLPVRYARMLDSPFAFLRGSAAVMAADLATTVSSGIRVQACGDCHLVNFGVYTSPEGRAIFDINDFDETLPAPFEWDVKRLAASIVLAGRHAQLSERASARAARAAVRVYRERMNELARVDPLTVWSTRVDVAQVISEIDDPKLRASQERRIAQAAGTMPAFQDFPRLAAQAGGSWRIRDNPPLIYHFDQEIDNERCLRVQDVFAHYRDSLPDERKLLYDRYHLVDTAFKVVGVGSVGTFCAIGLFLTPDESPLFLQIKEAQASVLAPYAGKSKYDNEGQRVVVGQRIMQSASDLFLGWTHDTGASRHFYVRQLKDRKLASLAEMIEREALRFYAELCGSTLARAHARSGDAALISGYLGSSEAFDAAIQEFAVDYADQSERDFRLLVQAVRSGRLQARLDPAR